MDVRDMSHRELAEMLAQAVEVVAEDGFEQARELDSVYETKQAEMLARYSLELMAMGQQLIESASTVFAVVADLEDKLLEAEMDALVPAWPDEKP